jgi:hypothetical protein
MAITQQQEAEHARQALRVQRERVHAHTRLVQGFPTEVSEVSLTEGRMGEEECFVLF